MKKKNQLNTSGAEISGMTIRALYPYIIVVIFVTRSYLQSNILENKSS